MKGKLKKMYWEILEINNVLYNVGLNNYQIQKTYNFLYGYLTEKQISNYYNKDTNKSSI